MKTKLLILLAVLVSAMAMAQPVYKLRVMYWTCITDRSGNKVVEGRVYNQSGKRLADIRVNARAVDRNGVARGSNSALIATRSLNQAQSSNFKVVVPTSATGTTCQIWFRNPEVIRIPTRVPALKPSSR